MQQPLQPQPETKASVASDLGESELVGVPIALAGDVDMAERDGDYCLPSLDVSVVDGAVLKRKRGRPARGAPKTAPPVRPKKDEEDVCFVCFDGGSLVLCDRRGCPKAYHPACIKRDEAFFRSKAKWNCGWHICSVCQKAAHYLCYTCTYSLCKRCTRGTDFVCVRENKGLCGICMRTIMLIENSAQGNKEKSEVDFDDKTSWEYLFKVYWMYLKGKLSLTFNELIQAKNACKGAAAIICKVQTPHELCHVKDDKGSGSENSCIDIESNNSKKRMSKRQPRLFSKGGCSVSLPDDSLNDRSWHYQDPTGKIQGPFSLLQLYKWNASGYFPPDLRIWRIDEKQHNSILLTDALTGKCSKTVSLPFNGQLWSLGVNVTLDNKDNVIHDAVRNESKKEISADSQIIKQSREQKVDDTSTPSNGKDESVRSNGLWDQPHLCPSILSTAFPEKLNDNPSDKLRKGHGIEGNSEDNGNNASNRTSDGQSNSGQTYQKQSDSEENSRQSSGQNWRHTSENSSSNCLFTQSAHVSGTETSPQKLGFDLHNPPSPPACNASTRQAIIGEPNDFDESVSDNPPSPPACNTSTWQAIIGEPNDFDESVSDLLAEVEAMESLGGLESPTSMIICGEELTVGSKNHCFSFVEMLDVGKGDALSSTGDLNLPSQSIAAEEPLQQADILHHQRLFWEHSSRTSKVEVGTKNVSVSSNQWESRSENSPVVPSPATLGLAIDTTWRLGSENTHFGWSGIDQENANMGWGACQTQMAVQDNRSSNSYTSAVTQGSGDSQTRYGTDRFSVPRDRGFHGHGRELGFGRDRIAYNRQPLCGVGSADSYRSLPKGQRVCKFYESGYCKKGASCDYLHQ